MKIFLFLCKFSKVLMSVSFLIFFVLYVIGFGYFLLCEDVLEFLV